MSQSKLVRKIRNEYRNNVRACRLRAEVPKQEVLALKTGIPRSTISALENNRLFLSAPYALLIKECLGCSLDDLYEKQQPSSGRIRKG